MLWKCEHLSLVPIKPLWIDLKIEFHLSHRPTFSLSLSLSLSLSSQGDAGEAGEPGPQGEVGPPVSFFILCHPFIHEQITTNQQIKGPTMMLSPNKKNDCGSIKIQMIWFVEWNETVKFELFPSSSLLSYLTQSNWCTLYYFRVQEESEEKKERPVQLVLLDLPALRVPLEMTVPKAAL